MDKEIGREIKYNGLKIEKPELQNYQYLQSIDILFRQVSYIVTALFGAFLTQMEDDIRTRFISSQRYIC